VAGVISLILKQLMEALLLVSSAFTPDEAVVDAFQGVNLGVWVPPAEGRTIAALT
jgi:hypothetical protein